MSQNNVDVSKLTEQLIFDRFNRRAVQDRVNYAEFIEEMTPRSNIIGDDN